LRARIEPKPRVQEITLLDRLDDGGFGALKFQGRKIRSGCKRQIFGATGKFLMKGRIPRQISVNEMLGARRRGEKSGRWPFD
jgi:hypothetical protein